MTPNSSLPAEAITTSTGDDGLAAAEPTPPRGRHSARDEDHGVPAGSEFQPTPASDTHFEQPVPDLAPTIPASWQYVPPPWEPVAPGDVLPVGSYIHPVLPQRRGRRRAPWIAAAAIVIVAGAGFGVYVMGKHPSHPASNPPPVSGFPATSISSPGTAASAALERIVVQPTDLSPAWIGTAYQDNGSSSSADSAAAARCFGTNVRNTDVDIVSTANSEDFTLGDEHISSSASTYRSQSDIAADTALVRKAKTSTCFSRLLRQEMATTLPAGVKITSFSMAITHAWAGAPANVIATIDGRVALTGNGHEIWVYISNAFIVGPVLEAQIEIESSGAPVPAPLVHSLVTAVALRAAKGVKP